MKDGGHEEDYAGLRRSENTRTRLGRRKVDRDRERGLGKKSYGSGTGGLEGAGFGKADSQANTVGGGGRARRMSWL